MKRIRMGRVGAGLALAAVTLVAVAAPAWAGSGGGQEPRRDRRIDSEVSVTGDVEVVAGQIVKGAVVSLDGDVRVDGEVDDGVYVGDGDVVIAGLVSGPVVVVHGDVTVTGRVTDDINVLDGRANVAANAVVRGDVRSSEQPRVSDQARVTGNVEKIDFSGYLSAIGFALLAYLWIAVSVTVLVIGIVLFAVFPRAGAALVRVAHEDVGKSAGWGAIIAFGIPIVAFIAIITIVGVPLGLGVMLALGILFFLGYVVSCAALGRKLVKEKSGLVAFLAGFGILRAAALIPGLGVLVWILASAYGVGVLAVASYRAGRDDTRTPADGSDAAPPPPTTPPPATPAAASPAAGGPPAE